VASPSGNKWPGKSLSTARRGPTRPILKMQVRLRPAGLRPLPFPSSPQPPRTSPPVAKIVDSYTQRYTLAGRYGRGEGQGRGRAQEELDAIAVDHFLDTLAQVALAIASRKLSKGKGEQTC